MSVLSAFKVLSVEPSSTEQPLLQVNRTIDQIQALVDIRYLKSKCCNEVIIWELIKYLR